MLKLEDIIDSKESREMKKEKRKKGSNSFSYPSRKHFLPR